jgi:integrase/recombinase XerD
MSDNTCEAYLNDLNNLLLYFEEKEIQRLPEQVSYEDLISFIEYIAEIGFSDKTQAQILSALKSFFKFMLLEDLIAKDPTKLLETPRLGRKLPAVLSVEEIETILGAIDVSTQLGHRNRAIIEVLYGCGLRVTELTELKISNIFYDEDFIRVIGKGDKQRLVPLGRKAKEEIDNYFKSFRNHIEPKKGNGDFLFLNRRGSKLTRVMVFNIVKEACATAGIKKNISPHTFRHSFATHLIEGGAGLRVVQEMLGHESITTTEIYTHLDREFLRETIIQFHPRS